MSVMKRRVSASALAAIAATVCGLGVSSAATAKVNWASVTSAKAGGGMAALVAAAKAEGSLNVIALPPTWANYGKEISRLQEEVRHQDQQLQPGRHERPGDPGDKPGQGPQFGAGRRSTSASPTRWPGLLVAGVAVQGRELEQHPSGREGRPVAVVQRLRRVHLVWLRHDRREDLPDELEGAGESQYKGDVTLNGAIGQAAAATDAVYAAALNTGGSVTNVQPGINFFNTLKSDGNFNSTDCNSPRRSRRTRARS